MHNNIKLILIGNQKHCNIGGSIGITFLIKILFYFLVNDVLIIFCYLLISGIECDY